MESCNETRTDINSYEAVELKKMKEEIKRAKDEAMQSWLDSRPLIDELEKLQSGLEIAKNRSAKSKIIISDLESQLESTYMIIRSKKEEEIKIRTTINKSNQELGQIHENMERLKIKTDEEKRSRSKLKQVLRLRKQRLRTLQLTLRAIRLESDAFGASADEAIRYINGGSGKDDKATVELSQEEYNAMKRRAKEETSLADWRVSVSIEQRVVAEGSRDSALRRLEELYSEKKLRKKEITEEIIPAKQALIMRDEKKEEGDMGKRVIEGEEKKRESGFPKARAKLMEESGQGAITREKLRRRKSSKSEKVVNKNIKKKKKKKKISIFIQFKTCFVRKITRWFG